MTRGCYELETEENERTKITLFYLHLFFIQSELVQIVRDQLCFSDLSSKVQPLPSERAEAEWKRPAGFRSEAAVRVSTESKL